MKALTVPLRRGFAPAQIWSVLVAATAVTWWVGEMSAGGAGGHGGLAAVLVVFALAAVKGTLVILDFMELRHAPPLWRRVVIGWLLFVISCIVFAYLKGTP